VVPWSREERRTLLVGHGPRSTLEAVRRLRDALLPDYLDEILAIHLADWRLNLDGGFLFFAEDVVVTHRASLLDARLLDEAGERKLDLWQLLRSLGVRVIEATLEESLYAQACNAICLGERQVVCYDLCNRVAQELERHDVTVHRVPGSELVKGRGGPRCMSRPVYRGVAVR
jgi:arginine deiminase